MKIFLITLLIVFLPTTTGVAIKERQNFLPVNKDKEIKEIKAIIYAYNAEPSQTDNDPCTTANGYNLCTEKQHRVAANNCLPFGTYILYDNEYYVINDRMNSRYGCEVFDIFKKEKKDAILFGKRYDIIKIIAYEN